MSGSAIQLTHGVEKHQGTDDLQSRSSYQYNQPYQFCQPGKTVLVSKIPGTLN